MAVDMLEIYSTMIHKDTSANDLLEAALRELNEQLSRQHMRSPRPADEGPATTILSSATMAQLNRPGISYTPLFGQEEEQRRRESALFGRTSDGYPTTRVDNGARQEDGSPWLTGMAPSSFIPEWPSTLLGHPHYATRADSTPYMVNGNPIRREDHVHPSSDTTVDQPLNGEMYSTPNGRTAVYVDGIYHDVGLTATDSHTHTYVAPNYDIGIVASVTPLTSVTGQAIISGRLVVGDDGSLSTCDNEGNSVVRIDSNGISIRGVLVIDAQGGLVNGPTR